MRASGTGVRRKKSYMSGVPGSKAIVGRGGAGVSPRGAKRE